MSDDVPSNWIGGEVLFAGATDWAAIGRPTNRKKALQEDERDDLVEPHRLKALVDIKIRFVASGPSACHCTVIDVEGRCFTWGRNEKGQLGHGDQEDRLTPTRVEAFDDMDVVHGSCGKSHTAWVMRDGRSFMCGSNAMGQCGIGEMKTKDQIEILKPVPSLVSDCEKATCGAEFTLWLCEGKLYAAGSPQYGVLGDGSNHEYNAADSDVTSGLPLP